MSRTHGWAYQKGKSVAHFYQSDEPGRAPACGLNRLYKREGLIPKPRLKSDRCPKCVKALPVFAKYQYDPPPY